MSLRASRSGAMLNGELQNNSKQLTNNTSKSPYLLMLIAFASISYIILNQHSNIQTSKSMDNPWNLHIQKFNHSEANEKVVLWSSDFHISPIADIKHMLKDYNVHIIDKSLSGHCHLTNTCETDLRVINKYNGINLEPCANAIRKEFYDSYKQDALMQTVDAYICTHAASMCELFMPFQKPLIVIASTRYEIGRLDAVAWQRWNRNLQAIAANPFHTIAANNRYDQEYIRYFTGIQNVILLPNYCSYVGTRYSPTRPEVLLVPGRGIHTIIQQQLYAALKIYTTPPPSSTSSSNHNNSNKRKEVLQIIPLRVKYPTYQYPDLAAHPAMVVLPYQVSLMSLFEYYRMEIPMFLPSLELLTAWQLQHHVLHERTWMGVLGQPQSASLLPRHPSLANDTTIPRSDPNNEFSKESIYEWLALSDFYQWPHIHTFDTWEELFILLENKELLEKISLKMRQFNMREEGRIKQEWAHILDKIRSYKQLSTTSSISGARKGAKIGMHRQSAALPEDINDSLQQMYAYRLSETDCAAQVYTPTSTAASGITSIGAQLRGAFLP